MTGERQEDTSWSDRNALHLDGGRSYTGVHTWTRLIKCLPQLYADYTAMRKATGARSYYTPGLRQCLAKGKRLSNNCLIINPVGCSP